MPARWLERSARATVRGAVTFSPAVAAMPFSAATTGTTAPLLDAAGWTGAAAASLERCYLSYSFWNEYEG